VPSISEVVTEYKRQEKIWRPRFIAIDMAGDWYKIAVQRVAEIEQQAQQPQLANNPSLPLATATTSSFKLGDRVCHDKYAQGSVVKVDGNELTIAFDKAGERRVVDSFVLFLGAACPSVAVPPVSGPVGGGDGSDGF
jgi:hypothetical protein